MVVAAWSGVKLNLNLDRRNKVTVEPLSCKGEDSHLALSASQGYEVKGRERRGSSSSSI